MRKCWAFFSPIINLSQPLAYLNKITFSLKLRHLFLTKVNSMSKTTVLKVSRIEKYLKFSKDDWKKIVITEIRHSD